MNTTRRVLSSGGTRGDGRERVPYDRFTADTRPVAEHAVAVVRAAVRAADATARRQGDCFYCRETSWMTKQTGFGGQPQNDTGRRVVRIETEIGIARPPDEVFAYVTTPALWHTWHPATVSVRNVPNRPLLTGETLVEHIRMFGHHDVVEWTVLACTSPSTWEIGTDHRNGTARIKYAILATDVGCRFHRTLTFRAKRWPLRLFASTLIRWFFVRQSKTALQNVSSLLTQPLQAR